MIDSATVTAIAGKVNSYLSTGQTIVTTLSSVVLAVIGIVGYIVGHLHGFSKGLKQVISTTTTPPAK